MIIEYPSRPAKCKDCVFCGYFHPLKKNGEESKNYRHKCKRTEREVLLSDRVCDDWKMGCGIPRNYKYICFMKKFKIKKGSILKIEGLPIVLQQNVIVECETDLTKTEFVLAEGRAKIEEVFEDDYQQRVFDEASELAQKIDKLKPFIYSDKFNSVEKGEQILLIQQLGYMTSYLKILKERMDKFE